MKSLEVIVGQLLMARAMEAKRCRIGKGKAALALYGLSALLFLIGIVFFALSLESWLELSRPAYEAQGLTGLFLLAFSVIAGALVPLIAGSSCRRKAALPPGTIGEAEINDLLTTLFHDFDLEKPIQENPKTAAALAALAGFIVGNKFL